MTERKISGNSKRFLSSQTNSPKYEVNLALVGPLNAGKSALTVRYMTQRFIGDYDPALEDTYCKVDWVEGHQVLVRVMDTSDHNSEDLFPERYLRWADCVLMVFSITSKSSFSGLTEYLDMWRGFGVQHRSRRASHDAQVGGSSSKDFRRAVTPTLTLSVAKAPTVILVAAKSDLESAREVLRSEMEDLAQKFQIPLLETSSAEDWDSVERVFHAGIREGLLAQVLCAEDKGSKWPGKQNDQDKFTASLLNALSVGNHPDAGSKGIAFRTRSSERASLSGPPSGCSHNANNHHHYHQTQQYLGSPSPLANGGHPTQAKDFLTPFRKDSKDRFSRFKTLKGIFQ
ncbi:ras-like protein family member 12 isoform X2 [Tigriopus californicus]|uniref:ras-like protein family member 12 isoform X2 n=1 Tax=Tigriopus californicus TaxID=6832 RepID=UPI0027DA16D3|nr:ras-like protein family member 12 isoform X2 [Tigriopus californicus]